LFTVKRSRVLRALSPRALAFGCLALVSVTAPMARAAESSAGASALRQARAAWEKGNLDSAEPLYREAIEKGGLAPDEILEGYVRLGSIRAANGKHDQAVAAFRAASVLDASFAVPTEAGSKGPTWAAQAKKDTAKIGSIKVSVQAPKESPSGKSFKVTGSVDQAHLPIVVKVALVARDGTSGKDATLDAKPEQDVDFEVPSDLTLPNASITVRFDALDRNGNRLASAEAKVKVTEAGAVAAGAPTSSGSSSTGLSDYRPSTDPGVRHGGGFWSSPWPYVIGGVALAGAGAAVYFGTRPSDDVSVGQVGVRTR
jgi:hypothetical protein